MKKSMLVAASIIFAALQSCEKNDSDTRNSSSESEILNNLTAASAVVASTQANASATEDVQSTLAFNYDSLRHILGPELGGFGGKHMQFRIPHMSDCAIITESDSVYPKTITIDYGTGCTDKKGHTKSGKIVITVTDSMKVAGASRSVEYVDFYVDSSKVEMSESMTNLGKNSDGYWVIVDNYIQKFTNKDGNVVEETYSDTTKWLSGFETTDKSDNITEKTGAGKITVNDTLSYSRTITKALYHDHACNYISSGIIELYKNSNTISLDYGDKTCDSTAVLTINGVSETIGLPSRSFKKGGRFEDHGKKHKMKGGRGCKGNGFGF